MIKIKICGITNLPDALTAIRYGADALGFIFADSPRRIRPEQAAKIITSLPPFVPCVGVFVNAPQKEAARIARLCRLSAVQLQGEEDDKYCASLRNYCTIIKAIRVNDKTSLKQTADYTQVDAFLFDAYEPDRYGGTGQCFKHAWLRNARMTKPFIVAGGITPENVCDVIRSSRPYGIDVSSGVENAPGSKDGKKIRRLIQRARKCLQTKPREVNHEK
ncbi:MAG: phosphoribosylanthranilate isomerase [Candidatus Omnitrophica bacterium]|nr:phosphoribosylanthranilate isomerase [Candidatus Omnitrophota bacterium]